MVCDIYNQSCMIDGCSNCPGEEAVKKILVLSGEDEMLQTDVKYAQWVTTDRCDLITIIGSYADFVDKLVNKLTILKTQHFISSNQATWVNEQVTLHPFVLYYRDSETQTLKSDSMCIISESLQHNTIAVHTF
jgi:hypothetical protein